MPDDNKPLMIDSHAHLDYPQLSGDLDGVLARANAAGVTHIITIGVKLSTADAPKAIATAHDNVWCSVGVHPHEAKNHISINSDKIIEKLNKNKKLIGIGESGLDFYYNYSNKKDQIKCFEEHIISAQKTQLPLIVHTRNAEVETFEILKKKLIEKDFKILIHCFTGSKEFAFKLLDLGAYISASGVVTFKKSKDLANTFKELPNNRILVETDSPYLAPVPLRGKPNEPSYIVHTVKFLSKIKEISFDDFCDITTKNFFNLFGKIN